MKYYDLLVFVFFLIHLCNFTTNLVYAKPQTITQCVSHRGLDLKRKITIENSMEAFKFVVQTAKARYVEFDILHTQDNIPIVMHDSTLFKTARSIKGTTCPLNTHIKNLTYKNITQNCELQNSKPIPTLDEVLSFFAIHDVHPFIDLKDEPRFYTLAIINKHFKDKDVTMLAINYEFLAKSKDISYFSRMLLHNISYLTLFDFNHYIASYQVYDGINISNVTDGIVKKWHRFYNEIGVRTVNNPFKITSYIKQKVNFITTDNFSLCKKLLTEQTI